MKIITISDETYSKLKGDIENLEKQTKGILTKVATSKIEATEEYLTTDCFKSKNIRYRDSDFDNYLRNDMPTVGGGEFSVYSWEKPITFKQMVQALLNTKVEDFSVLEKQLIAGGHTFSLKQIENILERTDNGEDLGLVKDGWSNLFFIHDRDGKVVVGSARLREGRWSADVYRFGLDDAWLAERRVSFRN